MNNQFAIVVPSCDKYSDLWEPFFHNLSLKWPDNPYKIYLISNSSDFAFPSVSVIKVGQDITWSANLKKALQFINEEQIFLLIDDLFPIAPIDTNIINKMFSRFIKENMNYLRLNPLPGPSGKIDSDGLGSVSERDYYRSSTVTSIWKKSILIEVLDEKESAWDFELLGSKRTERYNNWFASCNYLMPTINLVIKGKYDPVAYKKLTQSGITLSNIRDKMSITEYCIFQSIRFRSYLLGLMPSSLRRPIREFFLKRV